VLGRSNLASISDRESSAGPHARALDQALKRSIRGRAAMVRINAELFSVALDDIVRPHPAAAAMRVMRRGARKVSVVLCAAADSARPAAGRW